MGAGDALGPDAGGCAAGAGALATAGSLPAAGASLGSAAGAAGFRRTTARAPVAACGAGGAAAVGEEAASDSPAERVRALRLTTVGAIRSSTTFSPESRLR